MQRIITYEGNFTFLVAQNLAEEQFDESKRPKNNWPLVTKYFSPYRNKLAYLSCRKTKIRQNFQNSTHSETDVSSPASPMSPNVVSLHHCRSCGNGVCDDCSRTRKPVPVQGWDQPVRICDKCRDLPSPWNWRQPCVQMSLNNAKKYLSGKSFKLDLDATWLCRAFSLSRLLIMRVRIKWAVISS